MSSLDRINRARWSRDQKARAQHAFAAEREQDRINRLADLHAQVAAWSNVDGVFAAKVVEDAKAEITRLSL